MPLLQRILRKCFAWSALIFFAVFAEMTPILLRSPLPHPIARFHAEPFDILLMVMRELILVMPAVAALTCAIAWRSLRDNAPAARHWSIVASTSLIVLSTPFFVADLTILRFYAGHTFDTIGVLALAVALFLIGITGLATFLKRNPSAANAPANRAREMEALAPTA